MKSSLHSLIPFSPFLLNYFADSRDSLNSSDNNSHVLRVRVTLRLSVYRQSVRLGDMPLETHDQYFFFQLNNSGHSPYVTSSLTRGWVCRLQLLLALASAVILRSESRGTHDHILLSRGLRIYIPQGTRRPNYTPSHWVPFSSSPTTRRATVGVFDPASIRATPTQLTHLLIQTFLLVTSWHKPHRKHRLLTMPLLLQRCVYVPVA
jgi:hypothetical protein